MAVLVTLFYVLLSICIIYPPTEFVSAGFTIAQLFEGFLGSENVNFVGYHMKRISITAFIHSLLPLGYVFTLWCGGVTNQWLPASAAATAIIPLLMCYRLVTWWEHDKSKHPVVRPLIRYAPVDSDWRVVASQLNMDFRGVDKVSIPLTATSKFVATETWLIKVTQYNLHIIKQTECSLVATSTDVHYLTRSAEDEIQFIKIEAIPTDNNIPRFSFRISTAALRDLQPRLIHPVRVPEHLSLLPSLIERFVSVFKQYVDQNPTYYVDQELEACIGCMQATADVKLTRRCLAPPPQFEAANGPQQCQPCNCRVLWCCSCMARWWAARAKGPPSEWLAGRATCPVCRARFCLLDVCPATNAPAATAPTAPDT
ncbi:E3 ubiquitin-protein ligase TM129 [Ostrinia furnacalis]|uniref:E3 ubiquitin-protein ligase TM129 n=1 Tax=Ostrinia furnacalis TaxID=93504 RepID=UPI00103E8DE6|nr:E3 ubiquitin-protein ligase TM129 [Ostrinia furnacalis]